MISLTIYIAITIWNYNTYSFGNDSDIIGKKYNSTKHSQNILQSICSKTLYFLNIYLLYFISATTTQLLQTTDSSTSRNTTTTQLLPTTDSSTSGDTTTTRLSTQTTYSTGHPGNPTNRPTKKSEKYTASTTHSNTKTDIASTSHISTLTKIFSAKTTSNATTPAISKRSTSHGFTTSSKRRSSTTLAKTTPYIKYIDSTISSSRTVTEPTTVAHSNAKNSLSNPGIINVSIGCGFLSDLLFVCFRCLWLTVRNCCGDVRVVPLFSFLCSVVFLCFVCLRPVWQNTRCWYLPKITINDWDML